MKMKNDKDIVLIVVDRFSKMARFSPCLKTNNTSHMAYLFVKGVVKLNGIPWTIVSDKDVNLSHFVMFMGKGRDQIVILYLFSLTNWWEKWVGEYNYMEHVNGSFKREINFFGGSLAFGGICIY